MDISYLIAEADKGLGVNLSYKQLHDLIKHIKDLEWCVSAMHQDFNDENKSKE